MGLVASVIEASGHYANVRDTEQRRLLVRMEAKR